MENKYQIGKIKLNAVTEIHYSRRGENDEFHATLVKNGKIIESNGRPLSGFWRFTDLDSLKRFISQVYGHEIK